MLTERASGQGIGEPDYSDKCLFAGVLLEMLEFQSKVPVTLQDNGTSLLMDGPEGDRMTIRVVGSEEHVVAGETSEVLVRIPWPRREPTDRAELTASGGIVLAYLIGRSFGNNRLA